MLLLLLLLLLLFLLAVFGGCEISQNKERKSVL